MAVSSEFNSSKIQLGAGVQAGVKRSYPSRKGCASALQGGDWRGMRPLGKGTLPHGFDWTLAGRVPRKPQSAFIVQLIVIVRLQLNQRIN